MAIDLKILQDLLDKALDSETPESLKEWLKSKTMKAKTMKVKITKGTYKGIDEFELDLPAGLKWVKSGYPVRGALNDGFVNYWTVVEGEYGDEWEETEEGLIERWSWPLEITDFDEGRFVLVLNNVAPVPEFEETSWKDLLGPDVAVEVFALDGTHLETSRILDAEHIEDARCQSACLADSCYPYPSRPELITGTMDFIAESHKLARKYKFGEEARAAWSAALEKVVDTYKTAII